MFINKIKILLIAFLLISIYSYPQNPTADGYKGIWFTLGQFSDYGDKYSGGLGTYTADHIPIAIYSPAVKKTFFIWGGTTGPDQRHLLIMISYYDHRTHKVPKPVIVYDKNGINDPHDDAALSIDNEGYIWVFVSGRAQARPGFIFRSRAPYSIDDFEMIKTGEMTYPQPWWVKGKGFLYLLTKYTNGRELYWSTSPDGRNWAADQKLAGMGGHYQVTNMSGARLVSVFNYHPGGNVDKRTNIYAVQTDDMGKTWKIIGPTEPGPQYYGTGGEIAIWTSMDEGISWKKIRIVTSGSIRNNSYVRRPLNANKDFYSFWADGDADKLSVSHLYFSNKKGDKIWELPYDMEEEFAEPKQAVTGYLPSLKLRQATPATGGTKPVFTEPYTSAYTHPEGAVQSSLFSLKVNGNDVFCEQYKTYHYAHIKSLSAFSVSLTSGELISDIKISPARFGISVASGKPATSFVLPGPGYYVVRINQKHKLFILADMPDREPSSNLINVADLGIDNKGVRTETAAIQKALSDISGTGKTLLFPAGIYKSGSISIPSNTNIYLCAGAVLKGADIMQDFDFRDGIKPKSFIRIKDAENVTIGGRGIIDANGRVLRDKYADTARMRLLLVLNSGNITVDGIFVRDPGSWNTHVLYSENVTIRNVKMLNDIDLSNTDGFDPDASKNVTIENCFAYCSDDNVAIKTTGSSNYLRNAESITVKGCVFLTKKSSLKVGTESRGEVMQDILFEDNDVVESDRGMALYCSDGASFQRIHYVNNRFEDNWPDAKRCGINFTITKRNPGSKPGIMNDILVKDCSFLKPFPKASEILGFDPEHRISVTFDNLTVGDKKCLNITGSNIKTNEFTVLNFK